jgi:hypothetical protein
MFPEEIRSRQQRLSDCIYDLSREPLDKEKGEHIEVVKSLKMIYQDGFKHSYSDFFPVLLKIFEENNEFDKNYLTNNLELIRELLEEDFSKGRKEYQDIYSQVIKLCDHLNLQIGEMEYFSRTQEMVKDASTELKQAGEDLRSARDELGITNKHAATLQTELITVLGIFAAIIMTFSGGFSLLGSVMSAINDAKDYEMIILATIICGMVMFDTLFLMMYLIGKLTERNIYARCRTVDCSCTSDEKCSGLQRIRKRLPYVFYFNVLCLIGIAIDCAVWLLDIKGYI